MESSVRIDKYLSSHGYTPRRGVEEFLKTHKVFMGNVRINASGKRIDPEKDNIIIDGKKIEIPQVVYYMLHKPKKVVSTVSDEFGRKTVVSLIPSKLRLYPVGRLDQDTTGLLLLTNDGELANRLTHPRYHVSKTYELTIAGTVSEESLVRFRNGVRLEDGMTTKAQAEIVDQLRGKTVVRAVLHEGKKRQIRRMCERLHLPLLALKRISIGPILLDSKLNEGSYRELTKEELEELKREAFK